MMMMNSEISLKNIIPPPLFQLLFSILLTKQKFSNPAHKVFTVWGKFYNQDIKWLFLRCTTEQWHPKAATLTMMSHFLLQLGTREAILKLLFTEMGTTWNCKLHFPKCWFTSSNNFSLNVLTH